MMSNTNLHRSKTFETTYRSSAASIITFRILAILLAFYLVFLVCYVGTLDGTLDFAGYPIGRDFINLWSASVLSSDGQTAQIFDVQLFHELQEGIFGREFPIHNWSYPPHFLLYLMPLATLPYVLAYFAWIGTTFVFFILAMKQGQVKAFELITVTLAPATAINLIAGQNGFLSGALFIGGMLSLRRHPVVSGVLFGFLTYKPQLGILIPVVLIALRLWTPVASAIATAFLLFVASLIFDGMSPWRLYLLETAVFQTELMEHGTGLFTYMMPTVFMSGRLLGIENATNYVLQLLSASLVIAGTYWALRKTHDIELQTAIMAVGTFLAAPYAFNYDMTIVSAAIVLYAARAVQTGFMPFEREALLLAWLLPIIVMPMNGVGIPIGPVVLATTFVLFLIRIHRESVQLPLHAHPRNIAA